MKIFLSYGHDKNTPIVLRVKRDLEVSGHSVWIDSSEIKFGDDWRRGIVEGLVSTDWTLGFLSRHSTRNPGVCLDGLLLVTAADIASYVVKAHPELADRLPTFLDQRLDKLLEDPGDFVGNLLRGTAGRDYIPERNMSFLSSSVSRCRQLYKNGP